MSTAGRRGAYLALSYVWGGDQLYKTTKSTMSVYERGVDSSILPQTVRDAISVTYALGFQFLWVDTLCIIQDDDADRRHEIGRMHDIYRHAHITIIAASAENVRRGFLHVKRPPEEREIVLPFVCPPRSPASAESQQDALSVAQLQLGQIRLTHIDSAYKRYSDELGVMSTRAWCMQEYLMSPRSLIFTPTRLLFRCRTAIQGVGYSFGPMRGEPRLPDVLFLREPPVVTLGCEEWKDIRAAWTKVVVDYSRRSASVESDKLLACAAVAQQFAHVLKSDYLAGLWQSDQLLTDLLWRANPYATGDVPHRRPKAYRAPSWSWASLDGAVDYWSVDHPNDFEDLRSVALAEVVASQCRVTLEDPLLPFGRVASGTLFLRGMMIPCHRGEREVEKPVPYRWKVSLPSLQQARRRQWGLSGLNWDEKDGVDSTEPGDSAYVNLDCDADGLPERMWLVPFVKSAAKLHYDSDRIRGIVLEMVHLPNVLDSQHNFEPTSFMRIGYFWTPPDKHPAHSLWGPLARAIQDSKDRESRPWMDIAIV